MPIRMRVAGATIPAISIKVMAGGAARSVKSVRIMAGGQLRSLATFSPPGGGADPTSPLRVTLYPSSISEDSTGFNSSPVPLTSEAVQASPSGGLSPYSYSWQRIDGSSQITATSPAFAMTTFKTTMGIATRSATFRCTVSDAAGASGSADIAVTFTRALET